MRYFIDIAYNGTNYCGWQKQPNAITVQEVLETSMSTFFRKDVQVVAAGRTDAGVHAEQLILHTDLEGLQNIDETIFKLNSFLPADISIRSIVKVLPDAHARFNAVAREYKYVVSLRKDPFLQNLAFQTFHRPDVELMNDGAALLLDYQDFQCFSRSKTDVKTYLCDIRKASWTQQEDLLTFTIEADRFLRNMVRAIVGTLLDLGHKRITIEQLHKIIQDKQRSKAGASAPAHGLYLTKVAYPEDLFIK